MTFIFKGHEASELVFCSGLTTDYYIWGRDLEETWRGKKGLSAKDFLVGFFVGLLVG